MKSIATISIRPSKPRRILNTPEAKLRRKAYELEMRKSSERKKRQKADQLYYKRNKAALKRKADANRRAHASALGARLLEAGVCGTEAADLILSGSADLQAAYVSLDMTLFIRVLEIAREELTTDAQLHYLAERASELAAAKGEPLTMDDYARLRGPQSVAASALRRLAKYKRP